MSGPQPNAHHTGEISELQVATEYKKARYNILWPGTHQVPYDFVAERGGQFERVQVKSGRVDGGSIDIHVCSWKNDGAAREYGDNEIDAFGIYVRELEQVYIVPVEIAPKQNMRLRLDAVTNGRDRVHWAAKYEAEQVLQNNLGEWS